MRSKLRTRFARRLVLLALVAGLVVVPTAASAPADFQSPLFGLSTAPDGDLLVADAGQGVVKFGAAGASLVVGLPGVTDVAPRSDGGLWALQSAGEGSQLLYKVDDGQAVPFADLGEFEAEHNPHPASVESNPFDVADAGLGAAVVADAAGNDLVEVRRHGRMKPVAVLPDELVSTDNIKQLAGCPESGADFCGLPDMMDAQPVATSVAVGPDGMYYVGELKGFPAPTGESKVWRVRPNATNAKCGQSPRCTVALDGFTSIIDLAFGPDGRLYVVQLDDASWAAIEIFEGNGAVGGSVHACDVNTGDCEKIVSGIPILTSIAFRNDNSLWGTIWSLIPGQADVVQLHP
jgi:hypothetical protein